MQPVKSISVTVTVRNEDYTSFTSYVEFPHATPYYEERIERALVAAIPVALSAALMERRDAVEKEVEKEVPTAPEAPEVAF